MAVSRCGAWRGQSCPGRGFMTAEFWGEVLLSGRKAISGTHVFGSKSFLCQSGVFWGDVPWSPSEAMIECFLKELKKDWIGHFRRRRIDVYGIWCDCFNFFHFKEILILNFMSYSVILHWSFVFVISDLSLRARWNARTESVPLQYFAEISFHFHGQRKTCHAHK